MKRRIIVKNKTNPFILGILGLFIVLLIICLWYFIAETIYPLLFCLGIGGITIKTLTQILRSKYYQKEDIIWVIIGIILTIVFAYATLKTISKIF